MFSSSRFRPPVPHRRERRPERPPVPRPRLVAVSVPPAERPEPLRQDESGEHVEEERR